MSCRITFIAALIGLGIPLQAGCAEDDPSCTTDLACANQANALIVSCCAVLSEDDASCWYEMPDGIVFECDPIDDAMNIEPACEQAVADMTAYCSD